MYEIIDNLLPKSYYEEIKNIVTSTDFAWYWQEDQINGYKMNGNIFGFAHTLYRANKITSDVFSLVKPMIYIFEDKANIKVKSIHRMQINLLTNSQPFDPNEANHIDLQEDKYMSHILYLNTVDGDTVINDEHHITPKDNRCVYFKSNVLHRASPPQGKKRRMVINTVFEL
jgi:hypothetical protein